LSRIGAAFLCADLGITPETRDDHAAYISSWLKVLKDDKRAIFTADCSIADTALGERSCIPSNID
jgi:antirestriction protein ArdC